MCFFVCFSPHYVSVDENESWMKIQVQISWIGQSTTFVCTWFSLTTARGIISSWYSYSISPGSPWQQEAQGLSTHFQAAKDEPSFLSQITFTILSLFLFHSFGNFITLYNYFHLPDNSWWFHGTLTWFFCFTNIVILGNDLLFFQKYPTFVTFLMRMTSLL